MIQNKENLDFKYWSKHLPMDFEINPLERKQLYDYFTKELRMLEDHKLNFQSPQLKLIVNIHRIMNKNLS